MLQETDEFPRMGEYVVRVMCAGEVYGHYPSGAADLHSMAFYARHDPGQRINPDILMEQDLSFCIKFKDLVDNPVVRKFIVNQYLVRKSNFSRTTL